MPVTIQVAEHAARAWPMDGQVRKAAENLLPESCLQEYEQRSRMVQSSFHPEMIGASRIAPSNNGFVYTCLQAYNGHHHLTLRPEDIWFAILSQTGIYINAHASELRHLFVEHAGREELRVGEDGTRYTVDFGHMAERMTLLIQKNVLDPDLRSWIMPDFSTTTASDRVVAAILMMGGLQKYFAYTGRLMCGIPTVTLLGEREDWVDIQQRIPKLEGLGGEARVFASLLRPVLRNFIESFDRPLSPHVRTFWSKIVHESGGSGPHYLSGWMTAFCFWSCKGESLFATMTQPPNTSDKFWDKSELDEDSQDFVDGRAAGCELDGVFYHRVDTDDIPDGFATVPFQIDDNGLVFHTKMVAGSAGILGSYDRVLSDAIQPASGWWMYEVEEGEQEREALGGAGREVGFDGFVGYSDKFQASGKVY